MDGLRLRADQLRDATGAEAGWLLMLGDGKWLVSTCQYHVYPYIDCINIIIIIMIVILIIIIGIIIIIMIIIVITEWLRKNGNHYG